MTDRAARGNATDTGAGTMSGASRAGRTDIAHAGVLTAREPRRARSASGDTPDSWGHLRALPKRLTGATHLETRTALGTGDLGRSVWRAVS
jgi:hypothetical protein